MSFCCYIYSDLFSNFKQPIGRKLNVLILLKNIFSFYLLDNFNQANKEELILNKRKLLNSINKRVSFSWLVELKSVTVAIKLSTSKDKISNFKIHYRLCKVCTITSSYTGRIVSQWAGCCSKTEHKLSSPPTLKALGKYKTLEDRWSLD